MSTLAELKKAAAELPPEEKLEFFKWLANSKEVQMLWLSEVRAYLQQQSQGRQSSGGSKQA